MLKPTSTFNPNDSFAHSFPPLASLQRRLVDALQHASRLGLIAPAAAASTVSAFSVAICGGISLSLALAASLLVYSSYLIDHLADVGRFDSELDSDRGRSMARHQRIFAVYGVSTFLGAIAITALEANSASVLLLLTFPLSVVLYGTEWFGRLTFGLLRYRRLKDIPGIKAFYTAFFWGLLMVYADCFLGGGGLPILAFFFGYMLMSLFVNTVFCDFKDLHRDRADGVATLPLLLGVPQTFQLLHLVNHFSLLWLCGFVATGWVPVGLLGLALIHPYVSAVLGHGKRGLVKGKLPGEAVMDAGFLLWLPCVLLGFWLFSTLA
jgi:4-hydroxybenzoate polyprenyltransferase